MKNQLIAVAALALGGSAGFLMGSGALRTQAQPPVTPAISHAVAGESARIAALEKRVNALEARLKSRDSMPSLNFIPAPGGNTYRFNPDPTTPDQRQWRVIPLDKTSGSR
jgi:hypothetical protein